MRRGRRLTDPPGLETIVSCQLPGSFHPQCARPEPSLLLPTLFADDGVVGVTVRICRSIQLSSRAAFLARARAGELMSALGQDTDHGHVQIRAKATFESCDLRAR